MEWARKQKKLWILPLAKQRPCWAGWWTGAPRPRPAGRGTRRTGCTPASSASALKQETVFDRNQMLRIRIWTGVRLDMIWIQLDKRIWILVQTSASVADPDPYVFWAPGSGSGYFYHQAKIVRKTLIPTVVWLLYDLWCMMYCTVNVPSRKT